MRSFFSTALPLLICACTNAHSTHGGSAGQGGAQTVELGKVLSGGVPCASSAGCQRIIDQGKHGGLSHRLGEARHRQRRA